MNFDFTWVLVLTPVGSDCCCLAVRGRYMPHTPTVCRMMEGRPLGGRPMTHGILHGLRHRARL